MWLLTGLAVLSGLVSGIPLLNAIFFLIGLVSLIILNVRYGYLPAVMGAVLVIVASLFLYGPFLAIGCLLMVIAPAMFMSYQARKIGEPSTILVWGMVPYLIPLVALIVFYPEIIAQMPAMLAELNKQLTLSGAMFGVTGDNLTRAMVSAQTTFEWTIRLMPGIFATMAAATVLFGYLGAVGIGSRMGAVMPSFRPMYLWRASELWLLPLGLSLIMVLFGGQSFGPIGQNALVFLVHLYALYGFSVIEFYLRQSMSSVWLRVILYLLVIVAAVVIIPMLAVIGLIDSRFDLRKIGEKEESSSYM
ncbi:MAG: DUF2232 domain-containing protein [candidate division Zixibacteria bacterium]|nr:DUF2232 domain-containing protein [candidate division Zixibacteria bacterium]